MQRLKKNGPTRGFPKVDLADMSRAYASPLSAVLRSVTTSASGARSCPQWSQHAPARSTLHFLSPFTFRGVHTDGDGAPSEAAKEKETLHSFRRENIFDPHAVNSPPGWLTSPPQSAEQFSASDFNFGQPYGFANRVALVNEQHKYKADTARLPSIFTHLAMIRPSRDNQQEVNDSTEAEPHTNKPIDRELQHLSQLCERMGVQPPRAGCEIFTHDMGTFSLRYERHMEFSTYTFTRFSSMGGKDGKPATFEAEKILNPFEETALEFIPPEWLSSFPGRIMMAVHLVADQQPRSLNQLNKVFMGNPFVGSSMVEGRAAMFTDSRIHIDGFARMLMYSKPFDSRTMDDVIDLDIGYEEKQLQRTEGGLGPTQAGRIVRRLLEVESYRHMALLALPLAKALHPLMAEMAHERASIMRSLHNPTMTYEEQRTLLERICKLTARAEQMAAQTQPRFSANEAYHSICQDRIASLRMAPLPGVQPFPSFINYRLDPARRTVASSRLRLQRQCESLQRASDLLRTRVEVTVEGQNMEVLASMAESARHQIHLQELAEGFSVAAITYYTTSLLGYLVKGYMKVAPGTLPVEYEVVMSLCMPAVAVTVWLLTHDSKGSVMALFQPKASGGAAQDRVKSAR